MADFDVAIINPFLTSARNTFSVTTGINLTIGKPQRSELNFDDNNIRIIIGITGQMTGQVIFCIEKDNAKDIASKMMMGMPVPELDDMAMSAISELGNMIMGGAGAILESQKVIIDITPPVLEMGKVFMDIKNFQNVSVPLLLDGKPYLILNIVVKRI